MLELLYVAFGVGIGLMLPHGHRYVHRRYEPYRRRYDSYRERYYPRRRY